MIATCFQQHFCLASASYFDSNCPKLASHYATLCFRLQLCVTFTLRYCSALIVWATQNMNWRRKNDGIYIFFSDKSRFSFIPIKGIFKSGRNAALDEILCLCKKGPNWPVRKRWCTLESSLMGARLPCPSKWSSDRSEIQLHTASIEDNFMLMDDNCRLQRDHLVDDFLFEEKPYESKIQRFPWIGNQQRMFRTL